MDIITLDATARETGKKAAKAVRKTGHVPCVLYANGVDPVHFHVPQLALRPLIYTDEAHLVEVKVDGNAWSCILKEMTYHPVTDAPLHADFQVLQKDHKIQLSVPVHFIGTPFGVRQGGRVRFVTNRVEVECLPKDIPSQIDVNIEDLDFHDSLYVSDLEEEDITFLDSEDLALVMVLPPRAEIEEEEEEEEGALEEGEAAEGEEGDETAEA